MKKLLTILTVAFLAGCTKESTIVKGGTSNNGGSGATTGFNMQILDRVTSQPVEGASVIPYACIEESAAGCLASEQMGTLFTDASGHCMVYYQNRIIGLRVFHPQYWDEVSSQLKSVVEMIPEAWMNVELKKDLFRKGASDYPVGSIMSVSKGYNLSDDHGFTLSFPVPAGDTIVLMRCYGGINDRIAWKITDEEGYNVLAEGMTPEFLVSKDETGFTTIHF